MKKSKLLEGFQIKNNIVFIISLTFAAFLFRLFVGVAYYNQVDLINFNLGWTNSLKDGLFDVYARDSTIDYPPIFLMMLYPFSGLLRIESVAEDNNLIMFTLKLVPILIDSAIVPLLWFIFRDKSPKLGIIAAAIWSVNASGIVNSTLWGQTDTIMAFWLLLSFYLLDTGKYKSGGIIYGIACLTKFQSLYFAPVVVLELFTHYKLKKSLASIASGLLVGAAIILPFMLASHRPSLIQELYFGGFNKYNYATLNAYNFYGALSLNGVGTDKPLGYMLGSPMREILNHFNINTFGWVMLGVSLVLLVTLYLTARNKSIWIFGMIFMELIFMMTTKMHERYQFIVVPICLAGSMLADDIRLFVSHILLTFITGLNQLMLLLAYNRDTYSYWYYRFDRILYIMSIINVLLMLYMIYAVLRFAYSGGDTASKPKKTERMDAELSQEQSCDEQPQTYYPHGESCD